MAVQTQAETEFSTASFQCNFSKISQMNVHQMAWSSKFVFMNECEFALFVHRRSETVYDVSIQLDCKLGSSIHCKVSLINRYGKDRLARGESVEILGEVSTIKIKILDTEKEGDYFLPGDTLTVHCTLSVVENRDTEDDISNSEASYLACKELIDHLPDFLLNDKKCDVILHVQEKKFTARKSILKSRSKVFRDMFQHNMMEKCIVIVIIEDCDSDSFGDYLHYLYSGEIKDISEKNVKDLYCIASRYDAQELKTACLKFMLNDLSISSICDYIGIAIAGNEKTLLRPAEVFLTANIKDIIQTTEWKSLTSKDPSLATVLLRRGLRLTPVASKK